MYRLLAHGGVLAALLTLITACGIAGGYEDDWRPPRFEFSAFGGVMDYDTARHLNGQVYGGRFGLNMSPKLGFEASLGVSRATSSLDNTVSRIWISHANLVYHLLSGSFTPFVSGGLGSLSATGGAATDQDQMHFDVGGGVKMWMSDYMALRGDLHGYWGRASDSPTDDRLYGDIMATVSLAVGLGATRSLPEDVDADGIPDESDRCGETPAGVAVDSFGCPPDVDRDGVPDHRDSCTNTPLHAWVDDRGCPTDDDADGVYDGIDRCLGTPQRATVDRRGCPVDSDSDGVYDGLDRCIDTPVGTKVDEYGCPIIEPIERKIVLHSINFSSGKAELLPSSYGSLDEVAESILDHPDARFEVRGYADAMGSESLNLALTQRRAESVREYLIAQGVDPKRIKARGYGEADPIAPNDTSEGRAMNRRVEFHRID
jgi:OOP family OmpA-OmpF porin